MKNIDNVSWDYSWSLGIRGCYQQKRSGRFMELECYSTFLVSMIWGRMLNIKMHSAAKSVRIDSPS